jgi:spore germination protein YaaH
MISRFIPSNHMPNHRMRIALITTVLAIGTLGCSTPSDGQAQRPEFWGFTGPWDTTSASSVRSRGAHLDAVVTGWMSLDSLTGRLVSPPLYVDTIRLPARTMRRMAIVSTSHNARFHPRPIRHLAANRRILGEVAGGIAAEAAANGYRGLVIDFEALTPADLPGQLAVIDAIADSARARGISPVTVAIPAEDTVAYPARRILQVADLVLVMLYDQHWAGSAPGPVSGRDWFRRVLGMRVSEAGGADRLVVGLPLYGYRWRGGGEAEIVGFRDAERIAKAEGVTLVRDTATGTLRAKRPGAWEMWVTDAMLVRELVEDARAAGVSRFSLWRLGQEDPGIWGTVIPVGRAR